MIKPGFRIMPLLLALMTSFFLMEAVASAATLQEIRIGKKSDFTRLVFQFEAPPRFQVKANAAPNELYLTFLETSSGLLQSKQNKFSAPVKNIAVHQDGPNLVAVAALSVPSYRLKTFTLTEPHRVVFDLYPAAAVESLSCWPFSLYILRSPSPISNCVRGSFCAASSYATCISLTAPSRSPRVSFTRADNWVKFISNPPRSSLLALDRL